MGRPGYLYSAFAAEAADPDHPAHQFFNDRFDRDRDPDHAAGTLIALSDGLQMQWLVNRGIDMAAELRTAIDELSPAASGSAAMTSTKAS